MLLTKIKPQREHPPGQETSQRKSMDLAHPFFGYDLTGHADKAVSKRAILFTTVDMPGQGLQGWGVGFSPGRLTMPAEKTTNNNTQEKKSWVELIDGRRVRFIPYFRHYITGKLIYAKDYGHRAFMIPLGKCS